MATVNYTYENRERPIADRRVNRVEMAYPCFIHTIIGRVTTEVVIQCRQEDVSAILYILAFA